ncbi:unnamed protein product [Hymenolepis diminuta]|uniref:Acyl carrier protein n=1 Tax=Hymenolepis diminuta TaxID=6216 RepID=A0A0R3SKY7_HYMDI|nr:unnamed protein product [Hymenolepis diminuta]
MDSVDLTYQKMISKLGSGVGDNIYDLVLSNKTNSDVSFSFLVADLLAIAEIRLRLLSLLDKELDVKSLVEVLNLLGNC